MNRILKYVVVIVLTGVLLGIFTSFGQTYTPAPLTQLANSYSVWLLFSFITGYMVKSYKLVGIAVAGAVVQYIAILFYYIASAIRFDMPFSPESLISLNLIWIAGGTFVGPITAIAGALLVQKTKYSSLAIGFMAGLIFSEALYEFLMLNYTGEGIVFSIVGLSFLGFMYYKLKFPVMKTIALSLLFSVLMFVGYAYVLASIL